MAAAHRYGKARENTGDYVIPDSYQETKVPTLNFGTVDEMLRIAKKNGLKIRYHVFVWHAQSPEWFFREDYSKEEGASYVSPEVMDARMEMFIRSVMHHIYTLDDGAYKDVVYAWDVANEYFSSEGDNKKDKDRFWSGVYGSVSEELLNRPGYIKKAFQIAHDELEKFGLEDSVSLLYNDFNTYMKTDRIVEMIKYFNSEGKICDGIGMQSHLGVSYPSVDSYVDTVKRFITEGFEVQITELDVGCNKEKLASDPEAAYEEQAAYVADLTEKLVMLQRRSGHAITSLTWWGMFDERSWREEDVLMFGSDLYDAKPSYFAFVEAVKMMDEPEPEPLPTATPEPAPKYDPPEQTAPPVVKYDFTDTSSYDPSSWGGTSQVNEDGSITLTFNNRYAAFNFFLPDNAQNYYSNYRSVVLTYTSEGGNLAHALYDIDAKGKEDAEAGKHPYWDSQIPESPDGEKTIIFKDIGDCRGGCIRGLQVFNPNELKNGQTIKITIKSMIFCEKRNPTEEDYRQQE